MNGRVYDYNLGRFMSVDPFIQMPESSQSTNPYSYIMNNPMAGTDPTGYKASGSGFSNISHIFDGGGCKY
ncbi:RHS repeat-associated core domain-containing protein [Aliiglaciecola sp. LCG003]|uniref:RHS repeat-associated core domain-containing protein n=1 Tax=Aliiglaciecola sp. LCG003 TaxID=3053655 RepID=UPI0025732DFD|nr:RHS repeat-associated core domain-containing protein [Aliiglaciecola sp. LCG003]WJG07949.1 RHS repeat-associated core domain-containing protein [Aliiglaciecola sp. LCG003]